MSLAFLFVRTSKLQDWLNEDDDDSDFTWLGEKFSLCSHLESQSFKFISIDSLFPIYQFCSWFLRKPCLTYILDLPVCHRKVMK